MKKTQRKHKRLGYNQTKDHDDLYNHIEFKLNITEKRCSMGSKGNKFNICHTGNRNCPIRSFRLYKIYKKNI